jgi:hypothetical protein
MAARLEHNRNTVKHYFHIPRFLIQGRFAFVENCITLGRPSRLAFGSHLRVREREAIPSKTNMLWPSISMRQRRPFRGAGALHCYDMPMIGSGPSGRRAAVQSAKLGQAAINLKGTVDFFVENAFNYPTPAEAYKIAGLDAWNRMGAGTR